MNRLSALLLIIAIILFLTGCSKIAMVVFEEPVCGADHRTYSSEYFAQRAGVDFLPGKCLEPAKSCGCAK